MTLFPQDPTHLTSFSLRREWPGERVLLSTVSEDQIIRTRLTLFVKMLLS